MITSDKDCTFPILALETHYPRAKYKKLAFGI